MGCNCGKNKVGLVKRGMNEPAVTAKPRGGGVRQANGRSKVMFFAVPAPEDKESEAISFRTIYEARTVVEARPGWRVEARRVPVEV
jgi:hypothetical protein